MSYDELTRLAQQKGFFFKAAESYPNSPAGFMDYGPLGVLLKNNIVSLWRRMLVKRDGMLEVDGSQILPKKVFEASGHLEGFTDPFVRCQKCGSVFRPDKLIEEKTKKQVPEKLTDAEYDAMMSEVGVKCTKCGSPLAGTSRFNMMYRVGIGPAQEEAYLRPETCQSIFLDFPLLFKTQRVKLPVGVAQYGKSFRNEIAPRQGLIRMRELNQAEVEVFFNPGKTDLQKFSAAAEKKAAFRLQDGADIQVSMKEAVDRGVVPNMLIAYYISLMIDFFVACGLGTDMLRLRVLSDEDRAFYSKAAFDLEIKLSLGWVELVACNYRGDYDLGRHSQVSGSDFTVDDDGSKVLPHVFELSLGIDRTLYAVLESSMRVDGERKFLALKPYLAPVVVSVLPLVNKDGLQEEAARVVTALKEVVETSYDESGSIGRRYARADDVGTPFCVTIDYDTLKDQTVTLRQRDSKAQERVSASDLPTRISGLARLPKITV